MHWLFSDDDLDVMARVRCALDPELRMNPGKVLPLHACREVRTPRPLASDLAQEQR